MRPQNLKDKKEQADSKTAECAQHYGITICPSAKCEKKHYHQQNTYISVLQFCLSPTQCEQSIPQVIDSCVATLTFVPERTKDKISFLMSCSLVGVFFHWRLSCFIVLPVVHRMFLSYFFFFSKAFFNISNKLHQRVRPSPLTHSNGDHATSEVKQLALSRSVPLAPPKTLSANEVKPKITHCDDNRNGGSPFVWEGTVTFPRRHQHRMLIHRMNA